jgi:hypothetical protein
MAKRSSNSVSNKFAGLYSSVNSTTPVLFPIPEMPVTVTVERLVEMERTAQRGAHVEHLLYVGPNLPAGFATFAAYFDFATPGNEDEPEEAEAMHRGDNSLRLESTHRFEFGQRINTEP